MRIGPLRTHSTSLVSGLLLIGIGLLFLLTDGTAGLVAPTTVDQQAGVQTAIAYLVGGVSDAAVLLGIVLIALAVMAVRLLRRRGAPTADEERERAR